MALTTILWNLYASSRRGLFLQYVKLIIKCFFNSVFKLNIQTEKLLGYQFNFYDYESFVFLFEDVFIASPYKLTLKNKPFIVDLGGNIGMSVLFFKHLYPESTIYVFEPNKSSFKLLKKNVENNNLSNVTLFNKAVSNKKGKSSFIMMILVKVQDVQAS